MEGKFLVETDSLVKDDKRAASLLWGPYFADGGPLPLKEPLRLHAYVEPGGELQMVQDKTMVRSGYPEPKRNGRGAPNPSFSGRGQIHLPWRD